MKGWRWPTKGTDVRFFAVLMIIIIIMFILGGNVKENHTRNVS